MKIETYNLLENTEAKVSVVCDDALDWATAGALYSRSTGSIVGVLDSVTTKRKRIIEQYYVGYGHESIGDMVDVKLFIEGIPIWFAFMLEHHSRFRGQESSTRYVDFSNQPEPYDLSVDKDLFKENLELYKNATEKVYDNMCNKYLEEHTTLTELDLSDSIKRAMKARTFDICRGLLPVSCLTNVAWFGDINSIRKHLHFMLTSPVFAEMRGRQYIKNHTTGDFYYSCGKELIVNLWEVLNLQFPEAAKDLGEYRPHMFNDPWSGSDKEKDYRGYYIEEKIEGVLDFGSYRDLNRHRVGRHRFAVDLNSRYHSWYVDLWEKHGVIYKYEDDRFKTFQNRVLAHTVSFKYTAPKSQIEYVRKLRSKPTVHPTLRQRVDSKAADFGTYGFCETRGDQTIMHVNALDLKI